MQNLAIVPMRRILHLLLITLLPLPSFAETESNDIFDPVDYFRRHISPYEPIYFIAGGEDPNAKFQFGFKYQIFDTNSPLLGGFHFAYTQTSLWDLRGPSSPFFDSSYKPEGLYSYENLLGGGPTNWYRLDVQVGVQHESNGKGGADSRSLNIAYVRPTLTLGKPDGLHLMLQPRVWGYLGDLSDNPDIEEYRGYADLRVALTWKCLQLAAFGRIGKDGENHSVQVDLTYKIPKTAVYLDAQYFTGYGESLLLYNRRSDVFRVGISLYR